MKLQLVCFTVFLNIKTAEPFSYHLIKHFQEYKDIQTLLIVTCETTPKYMMNINNYVKNYNTWINILDLSQDISEMNFETFFERLSNTHIVVCSLKCNQSIPFFNEISKLKMFHLERNWLIFTEDMQQSVDVLSNQNINSDAEITLALPDKNM